jgi:hypothetical protein
LINILNDLFNSLSNHSILQYFVHEFFYLVVKYRKELRESDRNYHTLMLIPKTFNFYDALTPIRKEFDMLEKGVTMKFKNKLGICTQTLVKGCLSFLVGDSVQRSANNRHSGVKALANCPSCTVYTNDRTKFSKSILDCTCSRRSMMIDVIQQQMKEQVKLMLHEARLLGKKVSSASLLAVRTPYGQSFEKVIYIYKLYKILFSFLFIFLFFFNIHILEPISKRL